MTAAVAVVGATGYTGRLVVDALVEAGLPVRAIGRNPDKLARLPEAAERRTADATDGEALREALEGCVVAVSCVGPFVDLGRTPLEAILDAGCHYLDTTGEQAFMRTVFEEFDGRARELGVAAVPAVGFDYVPGDMAAALAARALSAPAERVDVYYAIRRAKASQGTKRTGARVMAQPCLVWAGGRPQEAPIGSDEHEFAFPEGTSHVALWPGGEVLSVPRHTAAADVRVWMRMPKVMAKMARAARVAAPVARAVTDAGDSGDGPDEQRRTRARYSVVAEARAGEEVVRCVVEGTDLYGMTAGCCLEAVRRVLAAGFAATGALATAEAFDPASFLDALHPWLTWRVEPL